MSSSASESYKCDTCSSIFTIKSSWKRHVNTAHNPPAWKCQFCTRMFRERNKLKQHLLLAHSSKNEILPKEEDEEEKEKKKKTFKGWEKNFPCRHCLDKFQSAWHLKRHIQRKHPDTGDVEIDWKQVELNKTKFICDLCHGEVGFRDKYSLNRHHRLIHKAKTLACTYPSCTRVFRSEGRLKFHLRIHEKNDKKQKTNEDDDVKADRDAWEKFVMETTKSFLGNGKSGYFGLKCVSVSNQQTPK
jgi:uncharacterized C2H2 Zn-finger protein